MGPALLGRHQGLRPCIGSIRPPAGRPLAGCPKIAGLPSRGARPAVWFVALRSRFPLPRPRHGRDPTRSPRPRRTGRRTASTTASPIGAAGSGPAACTIPRQRPPARCTGSTPTARATGWSTGLSSRTPSAGAPTGGPCIMPTRSGGWCRGMGLRPGSRRDRQPACLPEALGQGGRPGRCHRRCRGVRVARTLGRLAADAPRSHRDARNGWSGSPSSARPVPPSAGRGSTLLYVTSATIGPFAGGAGRSALCRGSPGTRPQHPRGARSALRRLTRGGRTVGAEEHRAGRAGRWAAWTRTPGPPAVRWEPELLNGVVAIRAPGVQVDTFVVARPALSPGRVRARATTRAGPDLTAISTYALTNRAAGAMRVWITARYNLAALRRPVSRIPYLVTGRRTA